MKMGRETEEVRKKEMFSSVKTDSFRKVRI